jgi:MoaA/NifB/PqqE/SkfB family radical SAM enzyme
MVSLNLPWLQNKLPQHVLNNLELVRFCGTYGDPCVHPDLIAIIDWIKSVSPAKIVINTNGGMRNTGFWHQLAETLNDNDTVWFGIDGLEDTNHIHRRNVKWQRLINNVTSFIQAGGNAVWQYLPFEHNQHQVEQAQRLSEQLGFKDFHLKLTTRFINKAHEYTNETPIADKDRIGFLRLPNNQSLVHQGYELITTDTDTLSSTQIQCIAKRLEMIYIGADGYVFPCGFLADRLYGFEAESHTDYSKIQKLFVTAGGAHRANLNYTTFEDIVHGDWFKTIEQSWSNNDRLHRCAHQCGMHSQLHGNTYSQMRQTNI